MLTINHLTIRLFGCEFKVPEKYFNGYIFCCRTGRVCVSIGEPVRENGGWNIEGSEHATLGKIPTFFTEEEVIKSVAPVKSYLVGGKSGDSWEALCEFTRKHYEAQQPPEIEEGRLYTWGTGASVYLRANKRVYLVEPNTGSLVDLGPYYGPQRLISYYSGFRYVSSWGAGNDKSSD